MLLTAVTQLLWPSIQVTLSESWAPGTLSLSWSSSVCLDGGDPACASSHRVSQPESADHQETTRMEGFEPDLTQGSKDWGTDLLLPVMPQVG